MDVSPWPTLLDEDRWLIDAMENRLRESNLSPERLRERAIELRAEAGRSDIQGIRNAAWALAERYEQAAKSRAASG